ncbi:MAG TPA: D-alanyl-lipoteichoic acid biosynthesis protein DltD, partial [Bacteroidia bacterium]|nr:D-alanyl-lipoteichoic acid biosynthesis protein DltD [Bacteroidia bacterium]
MKKIALLYFLPFLIALTVVYYLSQNRSLNSFLFQEESMIKSDRHKPFIENFRDNSYYEGFFLKPDSTETIFILGSSELTETSDALPYNFISKNFTTPLRGVGHAGNQCFSIYTQLLANEKKLKDARIVIILSPGWFESKSSRGTTSPLFLEFNSDNFLNRILTAEPQNDFHQYAYKGVSHFYNEF